ncbi:MAG: hypothetical protein R2784_08745 [Saprospiraceae bacterium]
MKFPDQITMMREGILGDKFQKAWMSGFARFHNFLLVKKLPALANSN